MNNVFGTFLFSVHFVESIYKSKSVSVQILWKLVTEGSAASFEEPQDLLRVTFCSMCLTKFFNNNNFFCESHGLIFVFSFQTSLSLWNLSNMSVNYLHLLLTMSTITMLYSYISGSILCSFISLNILDVYSKASSLKKPQLQGCHIWW